MIERLDLLDGCMRLKDKIDEIIVIGALMGYDVNAEIRAESSVQSWCLYLKQPLFKRNKCSVYLAFYGNNVHRVEVWAVDNEGAAVIDEWYEDIDDDKLYAALDEIRELI